MRASWYAKALFALTEEKVLSEEKIAAHFIGTVSANGHAHMLPKILRSYERLVSKQEKKETIEVVTATALSQEDVGKLLRKEPWSSILSPQHKRVERKIDPTVIGGVLARTSSARIDMTHKNMLMQIYQNMTSQL